MDPQASATGTANVTGTAVEYHVSDAASMDAVTLYQLLRLRVDVFVVEQTAIFADLDGRDLEPDALLAWASEDGEVLATVRILVDPDAIIIGRVATRLDARGRGLAGELMRRAVAANRTMPIKLDAQERLSEWYATFGFVIDGPTYVEDDILHVPMRRQPDPS